MIRTTATACVFVVALALTGCGGPDSLWKKRIALWNELADAIEKKDAERYQRAVNDFKDNDEKFKQLNLSDDDKKKYSDKYKADVEKAKARFQAAVENNAEFMMRVDSSPPKKEPDFHKKDGASSK